MRLLRVIEHDLSVGVYNLRIRPRLAVHAFVCKRRVRLRHRLDGHAPGQSAHRERRQVHVRERVSRRVYIGRYKRAESHFFLCELEAVFRSHLRDELDGDRVDGKTHCLVDVHEAPVDRVGVFRPVPRVGKRIRRIVHDRRGRDEPELQRGRVDGNGLDGRARGQIALRRAVQDQAPLLLAHAAGHSHNVAGLIVNDDNAGLQLLGACGVGDIIEVLINLLHCRLHVGVERGVNLIAARHEHLADDRLIVAGLFAEVPHHVVDDLIFKVGIVVLIAGRFAAGIMEHQLLRDGRVVLLLRDILLLEHLVENDDLPLLVLVGVDIRVVDRGVICDADERGALGKVELAHALAEIDLRRRLHALAVFAERDDVEIELHDLLFRVLLLKFQSAENFNKLPAHRDLVAARDIFDELLRDRRTARFSSSEEHFDAGLKRRHPVDTLMVFKALVLYGDAGMNEVLGNVLVLHPRAVRAAVELAQNDVLPGLRVFIINDGGLVKRKAVDRVDLRGEIVFDVQGKQTRKNQRRQKQHQHHRAEYLSEAFQNPPCRRAGGLCIFICSHVVPPFYRKTRPHFPAKSRHNIPFYFSSLHYIIRVN